MMAFGTSKARLLKDLSPIRVLASPKKAPLLTSRKRGALGALGACGQNYELLAII